MSTVHPENEKVKQSHAQSETQAEFSFANLPSELQQNLKKSEEEGVFVRAWTVRALNGDAGAALLFNQGLFWSLRSKEGPGGRFWLTKSKAYEQIGLSRTAYDRGVKRLEKLNLWSYTENVVHDRLYTTNWRLVAQLYEDDKRAMTERSEKKFNEMALHPS